MDFVAGFKIYKHFIENSKIGVEDLGNQELTNCSGRYLTSILWSRCTKFSMRDLKGYTWGFETEWSNGKVSLVDICKNTDISTISYFQMVADIHQLHSTWRSELFYNWFYMYLKRYDWPMDHIVLIGVTRGNNICIYKVLLSVVVDWLRHWLILPTDYIYEWFDWLFKETSFRIINY